MRQFILIISIIISGHAIAQTPLNMLINKKTTTASASIVAKIDFRASGTSTGLTNWNTMAGNPHLAVVTISNLIDTTGANTGWSCTSVATYRWLPTSNLTANNSVSGITGGSAMPGASTQSYQSIWFNKGTIIPARHADTAWQLELNGLNDAKTYTISISGSEGTLGFDNRNYALQAIGSTTTSVVEIDGGPGGGSGFTTVGTASYGEITLSPTGGKIKVFINTMSTSGTAGGSATGSDLAVIANMRIKQN